MCGSGHNRTCRLCAGSVRFSSRNQTFIGASGTSTLCQCRSANAAVVLLLQRSVCEVAERRRNPEVIAARQRQPEAGRCSSSKRHGCRRRPSAACGSQVALPAIRTPRPHCSKTAGGQRGPRADARGRRILALRHGWRRQRARRRGAAEVIAAHNSGPGRDRKESDGGVEYSARHGASPLRVVDPETLHPVSEFQRSTRREQTRRQ